MQFVKTIHHGESEAFFCFLGLWSIRKNRKSNPPNQIRHHNKREPGGLLDFSILYSVFCPTTRNDLRPVLTAWFSEFENSQNSSTGQMYCTGQMCYTTFTCKVLKHRLSPEYIAINQALERQKWIGTIVAVVTAVRAMQSQIRWVVLPISRYF